mmetsp:Transcript_37247/g.93537  ORF Transcript_37247/g.93537 Transcript_37247/m.93537 type:complete len:303 (+) Transcript_37247:563-1471(+)
MAERLHAELRLEELAVVHRHVLAEVVGLHHLANGLDDLLAEHLLHRVHPFVKASAHFLEVPVGDRHAHLADADDARLGICREDPPEGGEPLVEAAHLLVKKLVHIPCMQAHALTALLLLKKRKHRHEHAAGMHGRQVECVLVWDCEQRAREKGCHFGRPHSDARGGSLSLLRVLVAPGCVAVLVVAVHLEGGGKVIVGVLEKPPHLHIRNGADCCLRVGRLVRGRLHDALARACSKYDLVVVFVTLIRGHLPVLLNIPPVLFDLCDDLRFLFLGAKRARRLLNDLRRLDAFFCLFLKRAFLL